MQNKKVFLLALALVILVGGAALLYPRLAGNATAELPAIEAPVENEAAIEGESAEEAPQLKTVPNVTVYDADGNTVELESYFGKPIVMNFWASWCPPCKAEMPDFEAAYLEQGEDIHFLMVNMTTGQETAESAAAFLAEVGYTFPVLYDLDGTAASVYGAYYLPTTYFIDANGYAIARATGAIDAETLAKGIGMIVE